MRFYTVGKAKSKKHVNQSKSLDMLQLLLDHITVLHTYVDAVCCYWPTSVVCRSVT